MVPSSPYAPCSAGKTTSTSPSAPGAVGRVEHDQTAGGRVAGQHHGRAGAAGDLRQLLTLIASACRVTGGEHPATLPGDADRHHSYSSGSSAARMLPALTAEMACSVLRPPNTTATRVFRGVLTIGDPTCRQRARRCDHRRSQPDAQRGGMSATRSAVSSIPQERRTRPSGDVVAPLGPPVGGGVQAAERGGRDHQPDAREELGHRLGRVERERDHARDPAHLPGGDRIGRIAGQAGPAHATHRRVRGQQRSRRRPRSRSAGPAAGPAWPASGAPARRRSCPGWRRCESRQARSVASSSGSRVAT